MKYTFKKSQVWNLDNTFSKVIYHGLKKFKKMKRWGHPADVKNKEEWNKIIDKMLFTFENYTKYDQGEYQFTLIKAKYAYKDVKTKEIIDIGDIRANTQYALETIKKEKIDRKGLNNHRKKIKEGFELFTKHYHSLWD